MTDFRAELQALVSAYDKHGGRWPQEDEVALLAAVNRARAALAQPEPEGPTDEGLDELFVEIDQSGESQSWRSYARAVLARWGTPNLAETRSSSGDPADGEVAELANSLRHSGDALRAYGLHGGADDCHRAADLLSRLSPPQPIPVSERLPGPDDRNSNGECWWLHPGDEECGPFWILFEGQYRTGYTHWLPAHALPVPADD